MTTPWYCPENWRDLTIYPDWPDDQPRTLFTMEDNIPTNAVNGAVNMAEFIWPGGNGTLWAIDPTWYPNTYPGPWPPLTDPVQPIWPEVWPPVEDPPAEPESNIITEPPTLEETDMSDTTDPKPVPDDADAPMTPQTGGGTEPPKKPPTV